MTMVRLNSSSPFGFPESKSKEVSFNTDTSDCWMQSRSTMCSTVPKGKPKGDGHLLKKDPDPAPPSFRTQQELTRKKSQPTC